MACSKCYKTNGGIFQMNGRLLLNNKGGCKQHSYYFYRWMGDQTVKRKSSVKNFSFSLGTKVEALLKDPFEK